MEYWRGAMNWPVDKDWQCPICGKDAMWLIWGLIHSQCRCENCHTQFWMRDDNKEIVTMPIIGLKPEYIEPAKFAWNYYHHKKIDRLCDDEWDFAFSVCIETAELEAMDA